MVETKDEKKIFQADISLNETFINIIIISNKNRTKPRNIMLEIWRYTEFS